MLRQPADRLYSRYLHLVREDAVPDEGWDRLFDKDTIWWRRPDLVTEGYYHRHLSKFYEHFPAGNIKIFLYDDFRADPQKVLSEMFEFIG
ncbi:MAG: sulfotransferase domain-containing protein [Owenweeksia sp.]|nr:sulfotransferase domain-containing protein [Owenweeksia sp.]